MKLTTEELLLNDELAPITSEIGFLEVDCSVAVQAFTAWQQPALEPGNTMQTRSVSGTLKEVLLMLPPLTSVEPRRYLFVPTNSTWTAFFTNQYPWPGVFKEVSYLAGKELQSRGIQILAVPHTIRRAKSGPSKGRWGILTLSLYGPHETDWLNRVRHVQLAYDEPGRWRFEQGGEPFPFEDVERYTLPRQRDRFSFDLLKDYLRQLGLSPFDESFYLPPSNRAAVLVEKTGPMYPDIKEYTLEEARAHF